MRPRWWEGLDLGFIAFGLAALLIALLWAPPGPIHGTPAHYSTTTTTTTHGREMP
jgi:hypothetical protein